MKNSELFRKAILKGLTVANVDIETCPDLSWHYGNYQVNIDPEYTEVHTQITSIAYKDLTDGDIVIEGWDAPKGKNGFLKPNKDKRLLQRVIPKLKQYDILVGQNSIQFDIRKINWRLNELGLAPLDNLVLVDTLVESRKVFYAPSHRLNFKSQKYGLGGKIKQDMSDCVAVAKGDVERQTERMVYNGKDVGDDDYVFWKELDYYRLPKGLVNMLKLFIKSPNPSFCIKCAARKEARFDIKKSTGSKFTTLTCNRCDYRWKLPK